jgi:hypothetical protein
MLFIWSVVVDCIAVRVISTSSTPNHEPRIKKKWQNISNANQRACAVKDVVIPHQRTGATIAKSPNAWIATDTRIATNAAA